jgi:hypothetical protein
MLRLPRSAAFRPSERLLPVPANVFPFNCHRGAWPGHDCGIAAAHRPNGMTYGCNTAGLSLSTVVAAPEAASQEAMRVAPVAKGLPVTASGAVVLYG